MSYAEGDEELSVPTVTIDSDADEDELTQDWSQISGLSNNTHQAIIPKRGEKDYEPDGTNVQEVLLYKAKSAMFDALSNTARGSVIKSHVKAYYIPEKHQAVVPQPKGNFMYTMGYVDSKGQCWLQFYEFAYLVERGTVTPYWEKTKKENSEPELPLSLQDVYSLFSSQQEMDEFFVFAHLKRLGFIVMHTEIKTTDVTTFYPPLKNELNKRQSFNIYKSITSIFKLPFSIFNIPLYDPCCLLFSRYTSSPQIYQTLNRLIPYRKAPKTIAELIEERNSLKNPTNSKEWKVSFNVWKPQESFKKKSPDLPDFQVVVHNKNDNSQEFPTYKEFLNTFQKLDYKFEFLSEIEEEEFGWDNYCYTNSLKRKEYLYGLNQKSQQKEPSDKCNSRGKKKKRPLKSYSPHVQQMRRLKSGYRSFILAVMDDGLISFVRIAESDFGSENVWYVPPSSPRTSTKPIRNKKHQKRRK